MSPSKKSGHWWALLIAAMSVGGCSGSAPDLSEVERAARTRMGHFEGFERWARRTVSAEGMRLAPEALEETLFAPMRRDQTARALWVERLGPLGRAYALDRGCDGVPEVASFALLRSLDIDWARGRCGDEPILFLRRTRISQHGEVRITVAYPNDPAEP